jgi:hypothetical protein
MWNYLNGGDYSGRPRCRWEDNINTYFEGILSEIVAWAQLVQDTGQWWALAHTMKNFH